MGITATMLTKCLRELERDGFITRKQYSRIPPTVEYSLAERGRTLIPALESVYRWAEEQMKNRPLDTLEEALNPQIQEDLLIIRQVFRMQCFHTGHFVISVQKLIFALAHLVEGQELYAVKSDIMQKLCDSLRIGQFRVEARDDRNPGQNIQPLFVRPSQVLNDQFVADTCPNLMLLGIILLDIKEQEIEEGSKPVENFRAHTPGGLDRSVNTLLFKAQDQRLHKVRLHHAFAAGDSYTAAGLLIEIDILHTHIYDLINSFVFPFICKRASGAALYAGKTTCTSIKVNMDSSILCSRDRFLRTGMYTFLTVQTIIAVVHDLYS